MVEVYVHKTGIAPANSIDLAKEAIQDMEEDLYYPLNTHTGVTNLDNEQRSRNTSRFNWVSYVEDELYRRGYLFDGKAHVILYYANTGAGFSNFNVGADKDDGGYWKGKSYRSYETTNQKYGLASVNSRTLDWPYTKKHFKNTVIHELGHLFNCIHANGMVRESSGKYFASPMCTWYVEQDCYPGNTNNKKPINPLCHDDSGTKDACYHYTTLSQCTKDISNDWIYWYG